MLVWEQIKKAIFVEDRAADKLIPSPAPMYEAVPPVSPTVGEHVPAIALPPSPPPAKSTTGRHPASPPMPRPSPLVGSSSSPRLDGGVSPAVGPWSPVIDNGSSGGATAAVPAP